LGGGMNWASGVFTAPKAGIYAFSFKGNDFYTGFTFAGYGNVFLQRNGVDVARGLAEIYGATSSTRSRTKPTVSVHGTLKLNKGDTITIKHHGGWIFSDYNSDIQFTGSLIEEDLVIS